MVGGESQIMTNASVSGADDKAAVGLLEKRAAKFEDAKE